MVLVGNKKLVLSTLTTFVNIFHCSLEHILFKLLTYITVIHVFNIYYEIDSQIELI